MKHSHRAIVRSTLALTLLLPFVCGLKLQAQELPTARQIIERFIQVSGNYAALANTRLLISSDPFRGLAMDVELIKDSTLRQRQVMTLYDSARHRKLNEVTFIYNRDRGVKIEKGKKEPVTDVKELDEMHLHSYMFAEFAYRTGNYALELQGVEHIDGADLYRIRITSANGTVLTNYYDKESGFLVYTDSDNARVHLMDYQLVDGRMYPMTMRTETKEGVVYTMRLKAVYTNEPLRAGFFKL